MKLIDETSQGGTINTKLSIKTNFMDRNIGFWFLGIDFGISG